MSQSADSYYIPDGSYWPIIGSIGMATLLAGYAMLLNESSIGSTVMIVGAAITIFMIFGWFRTVINENQQGSYNHQVDGSFRRGMIWFIVSEVMFFACFFGALFYARNLSVPWLAGEGAKLATNEFLWSGFENIWPTNGPGELGGDFHAMPAWGLPALNTAILLSSGATLTWAHHALKAGHRTQLILGLALTVALGALFMFFQVAEYKEAFGHLNLTMGTGIYGSTFFMLTGFHGFHVTIGAIMLLVMLFRSMKGHFTPENHFAFEAAAWYWHFVDVVWLGLFIFVYWL